MSNLFPVTQELEHECAVTARLLNCLPVDRMGWRPHPKSMSLGQLAAHIAAIPGTFAQVLATGEVQAASLLEYPEELDAASIRRTFTDGAAAAKLFAEQVSVEELAAMWSIVHRGQPALTVPKAVALRLLMLNHLYHHRGQLSVYLRLLEVPLPVVYGASGDENPFA